MVELTVGQVSGMIATGVFIMQILLAVALPMILVAFMRGENNVVTWSVLGRYLHSSHWPTLLDTDTAATSGVQRRVVASQWSQTTILALVSVASIVTPLGLYDLIAPRSAPTLVSFSYLPDGSAFGYGTPPRSTAPFTRYCGDETGCPGQWFNQTCNPAHNNCTSDEDLNVPSSIVELFTNGSSAISPTVANFFDIQWRSYQSMSDPNSGLDDATTTISPAFRQLSILILDKRLEPVEGLIVDTVTGGIGFRNHTAPASSASLEYGASWTEDILFIQPETECVNLNITLDGTFADPKDNAPPPPLNITDRGGLSSLSRTPQPPFPAGPNGQGDLSLKQRAFAAGWLNNYLTLMYYYNQTAPGTYNITTNSSVTLGTSFTLPQETCEERPAPGNPCSRAFFFQFDAIQSSQQLAGYLNVSGSPWADAILTSLLGSNNDVSSICGGSLPTDPGNMNTSIVGCSILYGAANRTDGGSSLLADVGSNWSVPLYSCATALKASIRTVSFQYNTTSSDTSALNITRAVPKNYSSPSDQPLWGVESLPDIITMSTALPLWGLLGTVSNATVLGSYNSSVDSLSTLAADTLYLPGYMDSEGDIISSMISPFNSPENLPGADFYSTALYTALTINSPGTPGGLDSYYQGFADYSGLTSRALYARWQNLSASADTVGSIIDLVWTDAAANAVVGTKGWGLDSRPVSAKDGAAFTLTQTPIQVPVTAYARVIGYRLPFAIPAMIVVLVALAVLFGWLVLALSRRTGTAQMRALLDATSAGRAIGFVIAPEKAADGKNRRTADWIAVVGGRKVRIVPGEGIFPDDDEEGAALADERPSEEGDDANAIAGNRDRGAERRSTAKAEKTPLPENVSPLEGTIARQTI